MEVNGLIFVRKRKAPEEAEAAGQQGSQRQDPAPDKPSPNKRQQLGTQHATGASEPPPKHHTQRKAEQLTAVHVTGLPRKQQKVLWSNI